MLPEIGFPDENGNIRLNDTALGHSFAKYGVVKVTRDGLIEAKKYGWREVCSLGGLVLIERNGR